MNGAPLTLLGLLGALLAGAQAISHPAIAGLAEDAVEVPRGRELGFFSALMTSGRCVPHLLPLSPLSKFPI